MIWKTMIDYRWKNQKVEDPSGFEPNEEHFSMTDDRDDDESITFRQTYIRRRGIDSSALRCLHTLTNDIIPYINNKSTTFSDGSGDNRMSTIPVDKVCANNNYKSLLHYQGDIIDLLIKVSKESIKLLSSVDQNNTKDALSLSPSMLSSLLQPVTDDQNKEKTHQAQQTQEQNDIQIYHRIRGFLASRILLSNHIACCLPEFIWRLETYRRDVTRLQRDVRTRCMEEARLVEHLSLLVGLMQQDSEQIIDRGDAIKCTVDRSDTIKSLDEVAATCRERIKMVLGNEKDVPLKAKIDIVKHVITDDYGFAGNTQNYYDYRNSILSHVVKSKKGIPLTLSIVYLCVCRRLGLPVSIIGLPGHVVLGLECTVNDDDTQHNAETTTDTHSQRVFLDVFHRGNVLSVSDCRRICASYGIPWEDSFLDPLTSTRIVERVLNNLNNCHAREAFNPQHLPNFGMHSAGMLGRLNAFHILADHRFVQEWIKMVTLLHDNSFRNSFWIKATTDDT